jgi:TrmH family RNA methyltransferase
LIEVISSTQNDRVKRLEKLIKSKSARDSEGLIVLDGIHLLIEYKRVYGLSSADIFVEDNPALINKFEKELDVTFENLSTYFLAEKVMKKISPLVSPSGLIAIAPIPKSSLDSKTQHDGGLFIGLDGVQDPGNLGSILRTCLAFGVRKVFLSKGCADLWSIKTLRAGMGAQFSILVDKDIELTELVDEFPGDTYLASAKGGISPQMIKKNYSSALVIFGSEGLGISEKVRSKVTKKLTLPLKNNVESLNVAAAVSAMCAVIAI